MVDVVLPTGASIAAFLMAVISWYAMLRTGVQLVHNDLQAAKSLEKDVKNMLDDLEMQQRAMEKWKEQWLVWDDTPESLYFHFWGEAEYRTIRTKLDMMWHYCKITSKKMRKYSRLSEDTWKSMSKPKKSFLKLKFVWYKKDFVQKQLENMAKAMEALSKASKDGWHRRERFKDDKVDFREVYHMGTGHLLVRVAMRTRDDANALHQSCCAAQADVENELDLDIFNSTESVQDANLAPSPSSEAPLARLSSVHITKAAKEGSFTWSVLSQKPMQASTNLLRLYIEKSTKPHNTVNAPIAFRQAIEGQTGPIHFISCGILFGIKIADRHPAPSTEPRKTLRQLLSENKPPDYTNQHLLGTISKFRVAFELSQACLLFLRTSWFSGVCSCCIRCPRSTSATTRFEFECGLMMGEIEHEPAWWGTQAVRDSWCAQEYDWNSLTKPMRRLGILLVEIVLGTSILSLWNDSAGKITFISFVEGKTPTAVKQSVDEVLQRVYDVFSKSEKSRNALRFCLTKAFPDAPTDEDMSGRLAEFYIDVVAP
jgi:hypothetical protein